MHCASKQYAVLCLLLTFWQTAVFSQSASSIADYNAAQISSFLWCPPSNPTTANSTLDEVSNALLALPAEEQTAALLSLTPELYLQIPLLDVELASQIATMFTEGYYISHRAFFPDEVKKSPSNDWWISPLWEEWKLALSLPSDLSTYSYGLGVGFDHHFSTQAHLGIAGGFLHSHQDWDSSAGSASSNNYYLGVYGGRRQEQLFINLALIGSANWRHQMRNINFSDLSFLPTNQHLALEGSFYVNTGAKIPLLPPPIFFFIVPQASALVGAIFDDNFIESNASGIALDCAPNASVWVKARAKLQVEVESHNSSLCSSGKAFIGWLGFFPLSRNEYQSSFYQQTLCTPYFSTQGVDQILQQVTAGVEVDINIRACQLNLLYETAIPSLFWDSIRYQTGRIGLVFRF